MAACETCWETAYRIARMTGRHQADVYRELIAKPVTDGSHDTPEASDGHR